MPSASRARASSASRTATTSGPKLKDEGGSPRDYLERGRALLEEGRLNEAIAELSRAASLDPKLSQAHSLLAVAYDRKGLHDRAERLLPPRHRRRRPRPAGAQQPRLLALPLRQLPRGRGQAEEGGADRARGRAHPQQPRARAGAGSASTTTPTATSRAPRASSTATRTSPRMLDPRGARGEGRRAPRSRAQAPARVAERPAPARRALRAHRPRRQGRRHAPDPRRRRCAPGGRRRRGAIRQMMSAE